MATPTSMLFDATMSSKAARSICGDWTVYEYGVVTSTNLVAGTLLAWNAVRADTQTKGRGRFQRTWVSDLGGLWLSSVVPIADNAIFRRALPLAVGVALCDALRELGIAGFRLRWPNDVLVNERKLAGLLIDQFAPGLAVVGIGLNVANHPEMVEPQLKGMSIRLADLRSPPPALAVVTELVLEHLRAVLLTLEKHGASPVFVRANELWNFPRQVELDLDGIVRRGIFEGVDEQGRLILTDLSSGNRTYYDAPQVRHLTETQSSSP